MTFTEIQTEVAERLNLTSSTALARIGRSINERYRRVASSLGIDTIERGVASANTVVGNRSVTFTCEKIFAVYNTAYTPPLVLGQRTYNELRNQATVSDPAQLYAISLMGASTVTIYLNSIPATIYALTIDGNINLATISGSQVPAFAQDYHDILIYGAMATEYDKMEKDPYAKKMNAQYELRLSELRMFIAKSAYLDLFQGKANPRSGWVPLV